MPSGHPVLRSLYASRFHDGRYPELAPADFHSSPCANNWTLMREEGYTGQAEQLEDGVYHFSTAFSFPVVYACQGKKAAIVATLELPHCNLPLVFTGSKAQLGAIVDQLHTQDPGLAENGLQHHRYHPTVCRMTDGPLLTYFKKKLAEQG